MSLSKMNYTEDICNPIKKLYIEDKSDKSKNKWQKALRELHYKTLELKSGIIAIQSPTASGKTKAITDLLKDRGYDENNTVVLKKNSKTVVEQWGGSFQGKSLNLDTMTPKDIEKYIENFNDIECIILDESHELYSFLICGHSSHPRHHGKDHIERFNKKYKENKILPLYQLASEKIVVLTSDTLDSMICEELPMLNGIVNIDIVVVEPKESYFETIPSFNNIEDDIKKVCDIIENIYLKKSDEKQIIYVNTKGESKKYKNELLKRSIKEYDIQEYNSNNGSLSSKVLVIKRITIFVDGGISGIDDEKVRHIFSLRKEKSTVDSDFSNTGTNISYDFRQRVGRIRKSGGRVYLCKRSDITREIYIEKMKHCYDRSSSKCTEDIYNFMGILNKHISQKSGINIDTINLQRIPALLINHLKNDLYRENDSETFIQELRKYIKMNDLDRYKTYLSSPNRFKYSPKDIEDFALKYVPEICDIYRTKMKIESHTTEYHYSKEYIQKYSLGKFEKIEIRENINTNELKQERYRICGGKCEITKEKWNIEDFDLARIKEGHNGGNYEINNVFIISPLIHRIWDNGNVLLYITEDNKIGFSHSIPENNTITTIKNNMPEINKLFNTENLKNLKQRLNEKLSHE